ncbi:hypothetical protein [Xanthomonas arboricola]|uniref:hypothetical protein n=1 Tax=Xanthomonas arboricola TaxID=56448 RepID=UPI00398BFC62
MWPSVAGGLFVAAVVFGLAGWWILRFFREPQHMFKENRLKVPEAASGGAVVPSAVGQTLSLRWSAWSSSFSENIAMSDEIMPARILVAIVAIWAFVGFVIHFLSPWLEARIGL